MMVQQIGAVSSRRSRVRKLGKFSIFFFLSSNGGPRLATTLASVTASVSFCELASAMCSSLRLYTKWVTGPAFSIFARYSHQEMIPPHSGNFTTLSEEDRE